MRALTADERLILRQNKGFITSSFTATTPTQKRAHNAVMEWIKGIEEKESKREIVKSIEFVGFSDDEDDDDDI